VHYQIFLSAIFALLITISQTKAKMMMDWETLKPPVYKGQVSQEALVLILVPGTEG
jgi:hypothetical protein